MAELTGFGVEGMYGVGIDGSHLVTWGKTSHSSNKKNMLFLSFRDLLPSNKGEGG